MQRQDLLHELDIFHETNEIVSEELNSRHCAYAARIERRRMNVPALHQAEHLARHAAHLQSLAIEGACKWIERGHDVGDGLVPMQLGVRRCCLLRLLPHPRIRLLHHLFAEVHADQVVLKDVVVEHVLGGLAQVDDPLRHRRWPHTKGHILRICGAGRVIIAADAADAAGDEVRVSRIFALHEDAVAAEDRRSAVAFGNSAFAEIDLRKDAEAANDPCDRVPVHLHQVAGTDCLFFVCRRDRGHRGSFSLVGSGLIASREFRTGMPPLRFFVDGMIRHRAKAADGHSVSANRGARKLCARRLVHERHELIGKAGHGAADADAADVRAAANSSHPSTLGHVAVDHRSPAAKFHNALGRTVARCEVALS